MDNKKKTTIKQQIKQVFRSIDTVQQQLVAELHPVILDDADLKNAANWWYIREEGLEAREENGDLLFINNTERGNYASFKETNVAFKRMPAYRMEVFPEEQISVYAEAEPSEGVSIKIAIVEYSGRDKTTTTMVDVNKETQITLGKDSKYIRVAMKVTGKGKAYLRKMN
ncbi:hypothetical protein HCB83_17180, partial [Listeria booriae]|nr:hypothetical protein [Listeria booriae]